MDYQDTYFNIDHGYLEGLVRGFKSGILKQGDYLNLVQCESLEGKKKQGHCITFTRSRDVWNINMIKECLTRLSNFFEELSIYLGSLHVT